MILPSTILAAIAVLIVSFTALWSNPRRSVNRIFFTFSLHVFIWLIALHQTFRSGDGLWWLRLASAAGALMPWHLWMVKEAVLRHDRVFKFLQLRSSLPWLGFGIVMAALVYSPLFVPRESTSDQPIYGIGYYGFIVMTIGSLLLLAALTVRDVRRQAGIIRIELQVLLLGTTTAAISTLLLVGASAALRDGGYVRILPFMALLFYAGTAWAMTATKLFDARHLLRFSIQHILLVLSTSAVFFGLDWLLRNSLPDLPELIAFVSTMGLTLWFAAEINPLLQSVLDLNPKGSRDARKAAFDAARRETRFDRLENAFITVLKGWSKSDIAVVLFGEQGRLQGSGIDVPTDIPAMRILRKLRWATPERLARERTSEDRRELLAFMREHGFGAIVTSSSGKLSVVVGVGIRASRRPFTYPEITQLAELASIIENALARTHFSVKAQHAEQLATVGLLGASLAHEIRNPLVSIKTFVQLLPHHYQDQAFRDKFFRLIGDEVARIDRLTEQLLDLAAPRAYTPSVVPLHPVLRSSLELVAAKSAEKEIRLIADFEASPDTAYTDPNAAKQILLNLCFNAIQALEGRPGDRWVRVGTRRLPGGFELTVTDNGPGILPEVRPRLFQPFQSTKSTGFGLGLAICSDIVAGLGASIGADPGEPGAGATFRVLFPCQPPIT